MAHKYVWSGAAGAGTGADWANAYTTLKIGIEAAGTVAGDNIWVAHDHAETQASGLTITSKNTTTSPGTVVCANRAGSVPPVEADFRATATVTTTGASAMTFNMNCTYVEGIIFSAGTGAATAGISTSGAVTYKNCSFRRAGTTAGVLAFNVSNSQSRVRLDNCSVGFGNVADYIGIYGGAGFEWVNTAVPIVGAIIPTANLMRSYASAAVALVKNMDFTQLAAAAGVFNLAQNDDAFTMVNCKVTPSSVLFTGAIAFGGGYCQAINCDSGATNYRNEKYNFMGRQTNETTIVRSGGATDGTTPISWKIVATANNEWLFPFESMPITIWNDTTGAKTVSIYGYHDDAAVPTNEQIWIEVDYLGDAASPLGSRASSGRTSFLATPANVPIDTTSTWGGGDTTTRFKMSVALTAAMKGPISVVVKVAKISATMYIDPKIEVV